MLLSERAVAWLVALVLSMPSFEVLALGLSMLLFEVLALVLSVSLLEILALGLSVLLEVLALGLSVRLVPNALAGATVGVRPAAYACSFLKEPAWLLVCSFWKPFN